MANLSAARVRGFASGCVVLALMLLVEVVGMRSGAIGFVLIGTVVLLALAALLVRVDLLRAGVAAAVIGTFTLSWNGWYVGPVRPGDILILLALALFVAARPNEALRTPPWWIKVLVLAILLVVIAQIYFPPDPLFLSQRTVITAEGVPTVSTTKSLSLVNLGVAFKFIIAVAALPMSLAAAVRADRRAARWLPIAFATGCALSGWVALSDRFGTSISSVLTGLPNPGGTRQIGFSDHPNFLAPALVLAYPFAYWMLFDASRRVQIAGLICLPGLVGGVYASGSRGGSVAIVLAIVLSVGFHPRSRVYLGNVLVGFAAVAGVSFVAFPSVLNAVLVATRLNDPASTSGSDQVRKLVGAQAVQDFLHSPFAGIGLQVSDEAQQVYLQELASGGLILFLAMSIYLAGGIATSFRLINVEPFAGAVLAALLATLALNVAEANLTDRYYYLPAALLVAFLERRRLAAEKDEAMLEPVPAPVDVPAPLPVTVTS